MKKSPLPDMRDYSQKPVQEWTQEDHIHSFEHAIALVDKYTRTALLSTRGHVQSLAMIMVKKAYVMLLQLGWTPEEVATYSMSVMDEFTGRHPLDTGKPEDQQNPEPPSIILP